ncbi:MAG: hypothetical protein H6822_34640 [Planctomycetaceae bacterium]|nr:hypothetical protein [Planctomycetales bacterium]MCB9927326.1 hypothetical protein [Planctomycetaceae bacterium]
MNAILLAVAVLSAPSVSTVPDGSLLILRNSNKPVAAATGSDITHLAMVFFEDEAEWVYEATPAKVRRLLLTEYRRELGVLSHDRVKPPSVSILEPRYPYSELQIERMRKYARSQIGRRYSIQGYVRRQESDGIHCAQLTAATLQASGRFHFDEAYAISPGELISEVASLHKSSAPLKVTSTPKAGSWCQRSWATWFNYGAWCRWACYETWTFCW